LRGTFNLLQTKTQPFSRSRIAQDCIPGSKTLDLLKQPSIIALRCQRKDFVAIRMITDHIQSGDADRTGRAKNRKPLHRAYQKPWAVIAAKVKTGTAATRPSIRSRIPPCPGKMRPESFTP